MRLIEQSALIIIHETVIINSLMTFAMFIATVNQYSMIFFLFFSGRRRHTSWPRDWSSDVCSSDLIALIAIFVITILAIFGPLINPYSYDEQDLLRSHLPPLVHGLEWAGLDGTDSHGKDLYQDRNITDAAWLGTDEFGRDLWTRVWRGTQISLFIGVTAALLDLLIGVIYGGISAFYGGRVDDMMQRVVEILMGIPNLIIIILLIMVLKPGLMSIIIAMVITGWVNMARIVRGQILQLKNQEFVLASRALGASDGALMWRHFIPNAMEPIIVTLMVTFPTALFFEAFL